MRDSITLDSVLNEIRLQLIHPQTKNKIYILVEGDSDIRLYRSLFDHECCSIKAIPGGVGNLEKGISEISIESPQILAIRDADFMHLESKVSVIPVLFLTDFHDIETMMINSNESFYGVVCEFYHEDFEINSLRNRFLESVKFLGYLRWFNNINDCQFNFKGIGISDFFDSATLSLDETKCVNSILSRSPSKKLSDVSVILKGVHDLIVSEHDLLQVCCGHDITKSMALFFNQHNKSGVNYERIQSSLRIAYNLKQFQKSALFTQLLEWSEVNGNKIF